MYQPQVASWDEQSHMLAYAAVSYTAKGAAKPALGTVKIEADTSVALDERLVNFSHVKLSETHFSDVPNDQLQDVVAAISDGMPELEGDRARPRARAPRQEPASIPKNVDGVKADPPVVFYSTRPALLVNIDGDPVWSPIKATTSGSPSTRTGICSSTPTQDVLPAQRPELADAADLKGPWTPAGTLPGSFAKLPADDNWKDVKAALPGRRCDDGARKCSSARRRPS